MNFKFKQNFETMTTGKWIMIGEHAVLRGSPALVFPLSSATMHFRFTPSAKGDITLKLSGPHGPELELLFWGVLEKACSMTGLHRSELSGEVEIESRIPVGAGMGASAAFCVAVARWFSVEGYVKESDIENFGRQLEDLFHGESSGLDIAVVHGGKPIRFTRAGERKQLNLMWTPKCFLSYSGQRGVTRDCVNQVKELGAKDPARGLQLDHQMMDAVALAEFALGLPEQDGLPQLEKALSQAAACFSEWGLIDRLSESKIKDLRSRGARVVKPTGSGGGGYLLSLWKDEPAPADDLIACFRN